MIAQVLAVHPGIRFDEGRLGVLTTAFSNALIALSPNGKTALDNAGDQVINSNIKVPIRDPLWNFVGYDGKFSLSETVQTFFWRFLELLPLPRSYQNQSTKKWRKTWLWVPMLAMIERADCCLWADLTWAVLGSSRLVRMCTHPFSTRSLSATTSLDRRFRPMYTT